MTYEPAYADQARDMCRLGATDEELAEHFEVCVRTIYRWRNTHEAFAEAVIAGKDHADARVERALYSRAVGCTVERTRVFKHAGDPDPVYATYQHHLPPDPVAALQWLRVRQPKKWGAHAEEKGGPDLNEMIDKALARVADYRASHPLPSRQAPFPPPPPAPPPWPPEPPQELPPTAPPPPAPAMEAEPAPARPPVPVQPDPGSAQPAASTPAPALRPPLFERFSRNGGG